MTRYWIASAILAALLLSTAPSKAQETEPRPADSSAAAGDAAARDEVAREVARQLAEKEKEREKTLWKFGLRPNGGGFQITSPDGKIDLRFLGYAQAVGTVVNDDFSNSFGSTDLRIRRARVGWLFTYDRKYELFIEYDGVPQTGNLVEARLNWQLHGDDLQLRAGKFVVPLSEEGWRSSRNYDTVERFIVINSLYVLPAVDTQMGVMLHGQVLKDNRLTWYAGVWNGNASAAENNRDNNDDKEYQARISYKLTPSLRAGVAVDYTKEEAQTLRVNSLTGTRFAAIEVAGTRRAIDADFLYEKRRLSFRGEYLSAHFTDRDATCAGGFLQAAYFLTGDANGGFQPLIRIETANLSDDRVNGSAHESRIDALTAGFNWYLNNNVRLQVNAIAEDFNRAAGLSVSGDGVKPSLLTELQIRF